MILRTHQFANYFLSIGLKPLDTAALYLQNSPDFLFTWWGLLSVGVIPAFINCNLASDALVHSVRLSGAQILIVDADAECQARVDGSVDRLREEAGISPVVYTDELLAEISRFDTSRPPDTLRTAVEGQQPAALIYTSGTTGLSKAVPVPMTRLHAGILMTKVAGWQVEGERWYSCMPLYHGTGSVGTAQNMIAGASIALGKKFSTKTFWHDVRDSESTGFIYVGETARYLLAAPPSPDDKNHKVRIIFGNGMKADVWERFQERFNIPEVLEFFNSTEGMLGLVVHSRNSFGRGSVGHHGAPLRLVLHNMYIPVKLDPETGEMYRDPKTGFAIREPYATGGEILVKVPDRMTFPGYYKSEAQTEKMFAMDVFRKGDLYYKTGDALRRDNDGLWYFLDRLGDTFRWKGENVSTAEVAKVLGQFPGVDEGIYIYSSFINFFSPLNNPLANVYGIALPHHDGRAGCAALHLSQPTDFDPAGLLTHARRHLPRYAVPLFIRILTSDVGGLSSHNNKQDKVRLRDEGVDPGKKGSKVPGGENDEIWWLPPGEKQYLRFQDNDWTRIESRIVKL